MISCVNFIAEISNYLEGDLAEDVRRQLQEHLAHCKSCQVVYDSTRKTLQVVTDSGSFDLPESAARPITESIMAKIRGGGTR